MNVFMFRSQRSSSFSATAALILIGIAPSGWSQIGNGARRILISLIIAGAAMLAFLVLVSSATAAAPPEYRAFWVDGWGAGFLRQSQVDTLLGIPGTISTGQLRDANCNAVFIQVRRNCDACYPSSMGEPYMSGLSPANFNALQAVINAAHDTTGGKKRIEVHCWMVTFRTSGGAVYAQHDDTPTGSLTTLDNYWPSRDNTGAEVSDKAFDPGHPLALQYTVNVALDLVNNFDIDGIHYDYIRFTANNQGYNPTSIARYNARYGLTGQPSAANEQFKQWRRDQVSAVVRQAYAKIQKSKPQVKQSGSFVTWNPSPTSSTRAGFQATRPYYDVYSDWDSWLQEGIVDMAVPMTYYDWASLPNDYTRWINFEKDRRGDRHMIIGPGIYLNSLANAVYVIQLTRDASPAANHAQGFSGYSYGVPYVNGTWAGFSPSLVSQVTPTWADIPDMPWKSAPTKGHLMGAVTIADSGAWADGATVSITGPVNRSLDVDGTGFYAFIDLPPGGYNLTVSKLGYLEAPATVNVAVGEVTGNMYEQDFVLGPTALATIIDQPQDQTVSQGDPATFTVTANGTPPLYYQWRFYGTNLVGATDSSYTRANAQLADAGLYSVIVSNAFNTAISSNALLAVVVFPVISSQPRSVAVAPDQGATFSVTAAGTPPLLYQWRFNGAALAGQTAATLTVPFARTTNAGAYSVLVSNLYGVTLSSDALLALLPAAAGDNSFGLGQVPASAANTIAVAAGAWHNLALRADGAVVAWGDASRGQCEVPAALADVVAIAAGGYHSLALRMDGTVVAWGANDYGQIGVPAGLGNVIAIAAGTWHSAALRANGTVAVWGDNNFGQRSVPAGLTNVTAIAAGGNHTLALKADGTVVAWGENTDAEGILAGQSDVPSGLTTVKAIAAGEYHSLAVRGDGTVVAWGENSQGQCSVPPALANVVAVAGGGSHSVALGTDGAVTAWGSDWSGQCEISSSFCPASSMTAGSYHTVVVPEGTLPVPRLMNPARQGSRFNTLVQTLSRKSYVLECKPSLDATNWTALSTNAGNGALKILTDPAASGRQRFYRLRQW
ncbi:MAG TPA: family 10 glycosylhydrolase [Verrucomicrobiae bacterium]